MHYETFHQWCDANPTVAPPPRQRSRRKSSVVIEESCTAAIADLQRCDTIPLKADWCRRICIPLLHRLEQAYVGDNHGCCGGRLRESGPTLPISLCAYILTCIHQTKYMDDHQPLLMESVPILNEAYEDLKRKLREGR